MSSTKKPVPAAPVPAGRLRSFGFLVGGIFAAIGVFPAVVRGAELRTWALIVAACLVLPAAVFPAALSPVYKVWMKVGHLLGLLNNRIILGFVFYVLMTPLGGILKLLKKDPLDKKFDSTRSTYRVHREARSGTHMDKQF